MTPVTGSGRTWRREAGWVAVAIGALALLWFGWALTFHGLPGWFSDCSSYLFLADHFRGNSIAPDFAAELWRSSRFPPGFPLAIALAGGDTLHPAPSLVLTSACAVAAVAVFAAWFVVRLRSAWAGLALGLALLASPELFVLQLDAVSEPLFLALLGTCLLAAEPRADGSRGPARDALLMFALSLLPFVRAAGVAFLAAHLAWRLLDSRSSWSDRLIRAALPWLPFTAWLLYRAATATSESYVSAFDVDPFGVLSDGPVAFVLGQLRRLPGSTAGLFAFAPGPLATAFAGAVLLAGLVGACASAWRRQFAGIALAAYVGVVFVWPYPAELTRLLLVALPLGLALAAEALQLLPPLRARGGMLAALAFAALVLACEAPAVARIVARGSTDVAPELGPYRTVPSYWRIEGATDAKTVLELHATLDGAILELASAVPAGDCVYSTIPMLLARRSGVAVRAYPLNLASVDDARKRLRSCRYHFVSYVTTPQYQQEYLYPQELLQSWVEPVFVSRFDRNGVPTIAAVLALAKPDAARD